MTFADDIGLVAGEEPIEAIVIGGFGWGNIDSYDPYGIKEGQHIPREKLGIVLEWDEASGLLDYEYDSGYGAPDCHAITAWTSRRVIWVTQYDGATMLDAAPRYPIDHVPEMPGG